MAGVAGLAPTFKIGDPDDFLAAASVCLPELPSKLGLWRVFDDEYLGERRVRLQELLWHIVRRDDLLRAAPVREFVGVATAH